MRDLASIVASLARWAWTVVMRPRFCHACNRPLWRWEHHNHNRSRGMVSALTRPSVDHTLDHMRPHP